MKNIIAGTAGHIDHGKSTLVRALTGIEPDRLKEEKQRGISIDLGFAHLALGDVQIGFVDVPGHERFVRNMLAGAGGIDMVLLVVAAGESIKPQTREHFEICRLLGIGYGVIALTKVDATDADLVELTRLEVEAFVAGSFLEGAPIVAVSGVTGAGLDLLRGELRRVADGIPWRDETGVFRLPIDRSFSMRGFGTVVTGTTIAGTVRVEEEVELHPDGGRYRVRGLQVHGIGVTAATAGQRTAVNLAGVEARALGRGMTLATAGLLRATNTVDAEFELLRSAAALKHRATVHFHAGTAEVGASVRLLEGERLEPGARGLVRLILREPVLLEPGDRFIVRTSAPLVTVGGGRVLDNAPPPRLRRAAAGARLRRLSADPLGTLAGERPEGISAGELTARLGWTPEKVTAEATRRGLRAAGGGWISPDALEAARRKLADAVAAFHAKNPLLPGMNRSQAPVNAPILDLLLAEGGSVVADGEVLRLASHRLALRSDEDAALENMEGRFRAGGLAVPAANEVLAQAGVDAARARTLLQMLLRQGRLVRVSADLVYHASAIAGLREQLEQRKGQRFGVSDFKDWTGVSRKYAIPLLEYLDRLRVTRREGDQRLIL